jgi:hypothetical protein
LAQLEAGVDALLDAPAAPPEKTIGRLVDTWVETEAQRVRAGKLGLARANMNRVCLHHFLGQSPRTVADKHYVRPSDREFFEALAWLEGALGLKK